VNSQTEKLLLQGAAGDIQALRDHPDSALASRKA
jgi:hypothetical protein